MNKKQTKDLDFWRTLAIGFAIFFFMSILMYAAAVNRNREIKTGLEAELKQCRMQNPGLTIHYVCDMGWMNQTIVNSYQDFETYENALRNIERYVGCEVIEK